MNKRRLDIELVKKIDTLIPVARGRLIGAPMADVLNIALSIVCVAADDLGMDNAALFGAIRLARENARELQ
jgi:hypothetical protein